MAAMADGVSSRWTLLQPKESHECWAGAREGLSQDVVSPCQNTSLQDTGEWEGTRQSQGHPGIRGRASLRVLLQTAHPEPALNDAEGVMLTLRGI